VTIYDNINSYKRFFICRFLPVWCEYMGIQIKSIIFSCPTVLTQNICLCHSNQIVFLFLFIILPFIQLCFIQLLNSQQNVLTNYIVNKWFPYFGNFYQYCSQIHKLIQIRYTNMLINTYMMNTNILVFHLVVYALQTFRSQWCIH